MGLCDFWKFSKAYSNGETPAEYLKRVGMETALKTFIRHAHETGLRTCFENGLQSSFKFKTGENILQYAIRNCPDEKMLRVIVEMDPTILNSTNEIDGRTALHYAASGCSVDMNNYFYAMGGRPDIVDNRGLLPYYYAMNNRRANHIASVSLDALQNAGKLGMLNAKSAKIAIDAAKQIEDTEKYVNCIESYLTKSEQIQKA